MPAVNPVAYITSVAPWPPPISAQAMFEPLQAPDRRSTTASIPEDGTTVMVWAVVVAVNLYQTSVQSVLVYPPQESGAIDCVAPEMVPVVAPPHEDVEYTVNVCAPEQLLLEGGATEPQLASVQLG